MLGCQDFCGYYDWTFAHVRRQFGARAVEALWADAIGGDAQQHYSEAIERAGLRGLLRVWQHTGEDEHCDWTFTLDEPRNVLRWDMRQCPSKGFLNANDLAADEDYCDHCMGWVIPLLARAGIVVRAHEHNHCGQCWAELGFSGRSSQPLQVEADVRGDPHWNRGCLDRWADGRKCPIMPEVSPTADSCELLSAWFGRTDRLVLLGRGPSASEPWASQLPADAVIVTDTSYAKRDVFAGEPMAVLIGDGPRDLAQAAARFSATPWERRPLLMHTYLPLASPIDFASAGLPRPVPILPLLIRTGLYAHQPNQPYPTTGVFMLLLAVALGKRVDVAGIDLYEHPSGQVYAGESLTTNEFQLPARHSRKCDLKHLRSAIRQARAEVTMPPHLREKVGLTDDA